MQRQRLPERRDTPHAREDPANTTPPHPLRVGDFECARARAWRPAARPPAPGCVPPPWRAPALLECHVLRPPCVVCAAPRRPSSSPPLSELITPRAARAAPPAHKGPPAAAIDSFTTPRPPAPPGPQRATQQTTGAATRQPPFARAAAQRGGAAREGILNPPASLWGGHVCNADLCIVCGGSAAMPVSQCQSAACRGRHTRPPAAACLAPTGPAP